GTGVCRPTMRVRVKDPEMSSLSDDVILGAVRHDGVEAAAGHDEIASPPGVNEVVAGARLDDVVARSSIDVVVARSAVDQVVAARAKNEVAARSPPEHRRDADRLSPIVGAVEVDEVVAGESAHLDAPDAGSTDGGAHLLSDLDGDMVHRELMVDLPHDDPVR